MRIDEFKPIAREVIMEVIQQLSEENLNEVCGISEDVEEATLYLMDDIRERLERNKHKYTGQKPNEGISFGCEIFGMEITVSVVVRFCKNWEEYHAKYNIGKAENGFYNKDRILLLTVYIVGNDIVYGPLKSIIAHEIRHIEQHVINNIPQDSRIHKESYYKVRNGLKSKNIYERTFAQLMYLSSKFEQEGYIEQMYNEILNSKTPSQESFKRCGAYKAYEDMKYYLNLAYSYREDKEFRNLLTTHGYEYRRFMGYARRACGTFHKRLCKAFSQAIHDKNKKQHN